MNDEIPARDGGEEYRRRPDEVLACTVDFAVPASAGRLVARAGAATTPRDVGARPGNLWQVAHARETVRRTGGRT
ncbi:MAG TPA: hypothetical protein VHN14_32525 [Kofleriaceae bacterium]|nr:hypothetical protein [Kofleriaceae bacterium]